MLHSSSDTAISLPLVAEPKDAGLICANVLRVALATRGFSLPRWVDNSIIKEVFTGFPR